MKPLRIGIVAGEVSGDILGAGLIAAIKNRFPDAQFEGIGGSRMIAQGCRSIAPMERLSVMGLVEVLGRLFELLALRRRLRNYFLENPPDVFIGIDAPDFTLALEKQLKSAGIKTVHYVSPQIWAWRQGRVKYIAKCADRILTLFPFEQDFYRQHQVGVRFVGHPLADEIPLHTPQEPARKMFSLDRQSKVLALLPGSRMSEIKKLATTFLAAAECCQRQLPDCSVLVAAANPQIAEAVTAELIHFPRLRQVQVIIGDARNVMAAADALLVASGTVTLEATLVNRPMVVAYKMAPLTYTIAARLVKTDYIALPNLLSNKALAPEYIQDEATPEKLCAELTALLRSTDGDTTQSAAFLEIHQQLKQNASEKAADAVLELIN
ncbi:MAG: lipid-A-disaccharide synthase [Pseudomonadales bacterium]|nr:lipid-A-disaccharide synthase [Pseudomonadales bacterium]